MAMSVSNKVAWSEGVLLLPQHFQQADRYHEGLLSARLDAIDPLSWGVLRVELDVRALQQGSVALLGFEGILPDGSPLHISAQGGQRGPAQRPVQGHFPASQPALSLYLAVPEERPAVNNYAREGEPLRYNVQTRKVADATRDDQTDELGLAMLNPSLLFGDESRDGFVSVKIAEVVRDARGELAVSDSYIPPCLRVSASPVFRARLERLLALMVARTRTLSEARRLTGEGRAEFNAADVTRFLQLNALNSMFPAMHYLARNADVSPRTAFLLLSQLAGQLATFSADVDMTQPLDFAYDDLKTTFGRLFELNERLLTATEAENYLGCALESLGGSRYHGDLTDPRLETCKQFLLSLECSLPRPQVVQEFVKRAKVASHADLDIVLSTSVGGIQVTESTRPPTELPVRPGLIYFELPSRDLDVYWKHVWQDRNIVVWLPPLLEQAQTRIKLVGVYGSR
jgi:type VI secretion system protein ImpJ